MVSNAKVLEFAHQDLTMLSVVPAATCLSHQHVCLQLSSATVIEDAVTAVEDVVERLPDDFQLQQNVSKAVEAVEEIVAPKHLAEKRLKRKQQKARSA